MIRTELLPRLARCDLQIERLGLVGWSMGGTAPCCTPSSTPADVTAVAAVSPALQRAYG